MFGDILEERMTIISLYVLSTLHTSFLPPITYRPIQPASIYLAMSQNTHVPPGHLDQSRMSLIFSKTPKLLDADLYPS